MSATSSVQAPVATPPPVVAAPAVEATGGVWNEIRTCGANVLHLAYRVAGVVFMALQKVLECILSTASSGFDKVHTWITGIPSVASPENERAALEEAIRAADVEERVLGTAPPTATPSEPVSVPTTTAVRQLLAVQQLNGLAAASAGLSEAEQYEMLQLQQLGGATRTARPTIDHLTGGLSEADQLAALEQQTGGEPYVRPAMRFTTAQTCLNPLEGMTAEQQFEMLQMQQVREQQALAAEQLFEAEELARQFASSLSRSPTQQTRRDEPPLIEAAPPRLQIPAEHVVHIPHHQDGIAFLQQHCANLLNGSVQDMNAVLRPAAQAVVQFFLDPTRPFPERLPAFLLQPINTIPNAATFSEVLQQLHRTRIAEITGVNSNGLACIAPDAVRPMSAALAGRANQLIDRLVSKPAFQACAYGACDSEE